VIITGSRRRKNAASPDLREKNAVAWTAIVNPEYFFPFFAILVFLLFCRLGGSGIFAPQEAPTTVG
jgi:hypothetical protein